MTFDQFIRKLKRQMGQAFNGKFMAKIGELMVETIVERTRKGFGVDPRQRRQGVGKGKRLRALSESYIAYRQRNSGSLDSTTSPRKSNLTFTGQLLRSMRVKKATKREVIVGPNRRRRRGGRGLTNERLGEIVAEQGRPFNLLTNKDLKTLIKKLDAELKKKLQRL